jgi:hypothetical protein
MFSIWRQKPQARTISASEERLQKGSRNGVDIVKIDDAVLGGKLTLGE